MRPGGWAVLGDTVRVSSDRRYWLWRHGALYLGPVLDVWPHLRGHGPATAWRLLRFQTSRSWIGHLRSDRWLTMSDFESRYLRALPGGRICRRQGLPTVVWRRPA